MIPRLTISLAAFTLMAGALFAEPTIKLPASVQGQIGDFIQVPAETTGAVVRWYALDSALNLFPVNLLKDTKTAIVIGKAQGSFRLMAYTSDKDGPSEPALTMVVIGTPAPPGPGPGPSPLPSDPFFQALMAAYVADLDLTKAKHRDDLAQILRVINLGDGSMKTAFDVMGRLQAARITLMGPAFAAERAVIDAEMNKAIVVAPVAPLDATLQAAMRKEFDKIADYLGKLP